MVFDSFFRQLQAVQILVQFLSVAFYKPHFMMNLFVKTILYCVNRYTILVLQITKEYVLYVIFQIQKQG